MLTSTLGPVPPTARRRLADHYGPTVERWLDEVPGLMTKAAVRWHLDLIGYHDAGCASSIAVARTCDGRVILVKAWYDRSRYIDEVVALQLWAAQRVPRVVATADDLNLAAMELVGNTPGGAARPSDEDTAVARALIDLHAAPCPTSTFPLLSDYLTTVVLPRIGGRLSTRGADIPETCLASLMWLDPDAGRRVLLHGDLYRENVLFDVDARPVFIDPLPMLGTTAFDWAFWVVYYDLLRDPVPRLRLACASGGISSLDLLPWCLALCIDGLLYYREVGDPRAPRMVDVMNTLAGCGQLAIPC